MRARLGGRRLANKILAPVLLVLALFSGVLGFWVSERILERFLAEAGRDTLVAYRVANRVLRLRSADLAHRVSGASRAYRLADLLERDLIGPLGAAAQTMAHDLEADLVRVYDAQGGLAASSREVEGGPAREYLDGLIGTLTPAAELTQSLDLIPEALADPAALGGPRPPGVCLARITSTPLENDFGDRQGTLVVFRLLHREEAPLEELGAQMDVRIHLLQGSPQTPGPREGFPPSVRAALSQGKDAGQAEEGGSPISFSAGILTGESGESVGALAVTLDVGEFHRRATQMRDRIFGAGLVALAAFAGLLALVVRGPTRAVAHIAEHMDAIARGRLEAQLRIGTGDELEALATRINRTVASLRDLIGAADASFHRVEEVSRDVVQIAESLHRGVTRDEQAVQLLEQTGGTVAGAVADLLPEMTAVRESARDNERALAHLEEHLARVVADAQDFATSAEQTSAGMQEMSASVTQVADSMAQLSGSLDQTSQGMMHVDSSIREIEELAEKTRDVAAGLARDSAGAGREAMDRAGDSMIAIGGLMGSLAETIDTVDSRSQEIGQITTLISDIAKQTRLLAFNAAILASQAGERGTGFRVVADNIRALSERTTASLHQVRNHVRAIQEASALAREEGGRAQAAVEESAREVDRVAEVLGRIVSGTDEARTLSERIAGLTSGHAAASGQISAALQQVAATALQVAAAAQQQDATGREILGLAEHMGEKANGVRRATEEQAGDAKEVRLKVSETASAAERMSERTQEVSSALTGLQQATAAILEVVCQNRTHVEALNGAVRELERQADEVRARLGTFRLG